MSADEGGLGARVRAALDGYVSGVSLLDEITDRVMDSVADEFWRLTDERDRLTRERDEARAVVGRMRRLADEWICCPGDSSCEAQNYSDRLRAALSPGLVVGRDQAAGTPGTPKRPPEHPTSPTEPLEWSFDGPAVRPNNDDEETDR